MEEEKKYTLVIYCETDREEYDDKEGAEMAAESYHRIHGCYTRIEED